MPTQPSPRTTSPVPEPTVLTIEQQRRLEALWAARRALEDVTTKGPFSGREQPSPMLLDMLEAADWLLTGSKVERLDEHPEHVAITNLGSGQYTEVERDHPAIATATTTTMDSPWLHAEDLDSTRLCTQQGGIGTVMWEVVNCPECVPIMAQRTQEAADRADVAAAVSDLEEREAAGENLTGKHAGEEQLVHGSTDKIDVTFCGRLLAGAGTVVREALELVNCRPCREYMTAYAID